MSTEEMKEPTQQIDTSSPSSNDYIFGFGSIMNTSTHAVWKTTSSSSSASALPGVIATISKEFGYKRKWSFRSSTGFTALGVSRTNSNSDGDGSGSDDINGVIFQVPTEDMPDFDRREVGYTKIRVPLEYITIQQSNHNHHQCVNNDETTTAILYREQANFNFTEIGRAHV